MGNPNKNESSDDLKKVGNKNLNNIKKLDDNSLGMSAGLISGMDVERECIELQCDHCHRKYCVTEKNTSEIEAWGTTGKVKCRYCGFVVSTGFAELVNVNGEVVSKRVLEEVISDNLKELQDDSLNISGGLVTDMLLGEDGYMEVQCENCHRKYHVNANEAQAIFDVGKVQCRFCGHMVSGDLADNAFD